MSKIVHKKFIELYNKGLNDSEIAKILKVNNATVTIHRQKSKLATNFKYKITVKKDDFIPLYKKGYSDQKIAKILKVTRTSVTYLRNKLKLKKSYKEITLDSFQRSVLIGALLGDGHLRIDNVNAYGDYAHSLKQKEYALHKYKILKDLCAIPKIESNFDKRAQINRKRIHIRFLSNPYLTSIYTNLYINKRKVFSKELAKEFNIVSLAYLFMDDGYKHKDSYGIALNSFDQNSQNIFINWFQEKGIKASFHKNGILYIHKENAEYFKKLIEPYIIDSMRYKL